jgi:hypothetical protein
MMIVGLDFLVGRDGHHDIDRQEQPAMVRRNSSK